MTAAREAAYRSLLRIEKAGRYSNLETDAALKKGGLSDMDARLYTRLVYGVIEKKLTLAYYLSHCADRPFDKIDAAVSVILRLGAYQILYSDGIADFAAVNESVELAKKYAKSSAPFVNAVLRRLTREKDRIGFPDGQSDPIGYLSTFFSVSPQVCALLMSDLGYEGCKAFLQAVNDPPKMTLRVNTLKTDREKLKNELKESGCEAEETPFSPDGLRVSGSAGERISSDDRFFVQDEASQLAVKALDARPGMTVLDLCACPGGKSFGAAMDMKNEGRVCSFDLHENKLPLIEKGAARLGITIIETAARDGRTFLPEHEERADRVLVDAPCSGLGVMAKKPELRYKNAEETAHLPEIQRAILDNASRCVRPGGRLIYSTCTVLKRENENVVSAFLADHPDFEETDLCIPAAKKGQSAITLLPQIHHTDGFFIAAMKKKEQKKIPGKEDLVSLEKYLPEALIDLRYATTDNFTGQRIYQSCEAFLRYGTVLKLQKAARILKEQGLFIKIWDAFRPTSAQFRLFEVCPDPRFVADPHTGFSDHSRGCAVDLTLCREDGADLEMPSPFDDFSGKADRSYAACAPGEKENALLLERTMTSCGFVPYPDEWWHFCDGERYEVIREP